MNKDDELVSGLQIMTPEETFETRKGNGEEETPAEETTTAAEIENNNELVIEPPSDKKPEESEEEFEKKHTDESVKKPAAQPSDKSALYSAFIKDMMDEGVIKTVEEEEKLKELLGNASLDTIKTLMEETVSERVNSKQDAWIKGLSPEKQRFLEIEDAFEDTNTAIRVAQRLEYLDNLDPNLLRQDLKTQQDLYYEDLKIKGYSHEDAVEAIQEAEALNKLEDKALKALTSIKKHDSRLVAENLESQQEERERLQQENKEAFDGLMNTIDTRESFIEGLKLNKTIREKLKNNITTPVHEDTHGNRLTSLMYKQRQNPQEFDMLINYFDVLGLFNIDKSGNFKPDLSKLKNIAKTQAVSEMDSVFSQTKPVGQGNSSDMTDKQSRIFSILEGAKKK